MKNNYRYITILLMLAFLFLLLIDCKPKNQFQEFYSGLPVLSLPLFFDCGECKNINLPTTHSRDIPKYSQYLPCDLVRGRFPQNKEFIVILYGCVGDWIYPEIFTFSQEGKRIDSLFISVYCEGEPGYHGHSLMSISTDQIITTMDTIETAKVDSNHNEIPGTDSLFVLVKRYKINPSGHFESIEDSKKILHP